MPQQPADLVSCLFSSRTQAHIFHLQTKSFSEHAALNEYYHEIVELTDDLVQIIQGIYPEIKQYTNFELQDWMSTEDTTTYFQELYQEIQSERQDFPQESWIQNKIDEIAELVANTLYKLKFLS
jgi:hypothetical protein